jgi:hypothetical protein
MEITRFETIPYLFCGLLCVTTKHNMFLVKRIENRTINNGRKGYYKLSRSKNPTIKYLRTEFVEIRVRQINNPVWHRPIFAVHYCNTTILAVQYYNEIHKYG